MAITYWLVVLLVLSGFRVTLTYDLSQKTSHAPWTTALIDVKASVTASQGSTGFDIRNTKKEFVEAAASTLALDAVEAYRDIHVSSNERQVPNAVGRQCKGVLDAFLRDRHSLIDGESYQLRDEFKLDEVEYWGKDITNETKNPEEENFIADPEKFRNLVPCPGWEEWNFAEMKQLLAKLPRAVYEKSVGYALESDKRKLTLNAIFRAIKDWLDSGLVQSSDIVAENSRGSVGKSEPMMDTNLLVLETCNRIQAQELALKQMYVDFTVTLQGEEAAKENLSNPHHWYFKINKMQVGMVIGVIEERISSQLSDWGDLRCNGKSWYWKSFGSHAYLAVGDFLVQRTHYAFGEGDVVALQLDMDKRQLNFSLMRRTKSFHIGTLSNIMGTIIPGVCLQCKDDSVSFDPNTTENFIDKVPPSNNDAKRTVAPQLSGHVEICRKDSYEVQTYYNNVGSSSLHAEKLLQDAEDLLETVHATKRIAIHGSSFNHPLVLAKRALDAAKAIASKDASTHSRDIIVHGLSHAVVLEDLKSMFGKCGEIKNMVIRTDRDFLHPRHRKLADVFSDCQNRLAIITFGDPIDQNAALALDGMKLKDRQISVKALERSGAAISPAERKALIKANDRHVVLDKKLKKLLKDMEKSAQDALTNVFLALSKNDLTIAKIALEKATNFISCLPPGQLLKVHQTILEEELRSLQQQLTVSRAKLNRELARLREGQNAHKRERITRLEEDLFNRGELVGVIKEDVRYLRETIETNDEIQVGKIVSKYQHQEFKLQAEYARRLQDDLSARLLRATELVNSSYPQLSDHFMESRLAQLQLLTERGEGALYPKHGASYDLVTCWHCVCEAQSLLELPISHDDFRSLMGLTVDRDVLTKVLDCKVLTMQHLPSLFVVGRVDLAHSPDKAKLAKKVIALDRRVAQLRSLYFEHEKPIHEEIQEHCSVMTRNMRAYEDAPNGQYVTAAFKALRSAEDLQKQLLHKDRGISEVTRLGTAIHHMVQADTSKQLTEMRITANHTDVFLSFDYGDRYWPKDFDHSRGMPDAIRTRLISQEILDMEEVRGEMRTMVRAKDWLTSKGWRVSVYAPSARKSGANAYASTTGVRLTLTLANNKSPLPAQRLLTTLPTILAKLCMKMRAKDKEAQLTRDFDAKRQSLSSDQLKEQMTVRQYQMLVKDLASVVNDIAEMYYEPDASRFEIIKITEVQQEHVLYVDLRITSFRSPSLYLTSDNIADLLFRAIEDRDIMLGAAENIRSCNWPFPLDGSTRSTAHGTEEVPDGSHVRESTDQPETEALPDKELTDLIEHSFFVVPLITATYIARCNAGSSKALEEIQCAAALRGVHNIVPAIVGDVGPPCAWEGQIGDLLSTASAIDCRLDHFEQGMERLNQLLVAKGLSRRKEAGKRDKSNTDTADSAPGLDRCQR